MTTTTRQLFYEDAPLGHSLPSATVRLTIPYMMRWCSATEIFTRRDHFDLAYVQKYTDLKDVVGSGDWSHTYLWHYFRRWAGLSGWLLKLAHQNRAHLFAGDVLTAWAKVTHTEVKDGLGYVDLEGSLRRERDGVDVVPARATVVLPLKGGRPVPYPFRP